MARELLFPPEILGEAYKLLPELSYPDVGLHPQSRLFVPLLVSSYWRRTALSIPSLWTKVEITGNNIQAVGRCTLDEWLRLSGNCLLDISLDLSGEETVENTQTDWGFTLSERSALILSAVLTDSPRLKRLALKADMLHISTLIAGLCRATSLKILEIEQTEFKSSDRPFRDKLISHWRPIAIRKARPKALREAIPLPSLKKLELSYGESLGEIWEFECPILEDLTLVNLGRKNRFEDEEEVDRIEVIDGHLTKLLSSSPFLEHLRLRGTCIEPSNNSEKLSKALQSLLRLSVDENTIGDGWVHQIIAATQKLNALEIEFDYDIPPLPSCARISSLSLKCIFTEPDVYYGSDSDLVMDLNCLDSFTNISELKLSWHNGLENPTEKISCRLVIEDLARPERDGTFICPSLERLELDGLYGIKESLLLKLSRSRNSSTTLACRTFRVRANKCYDIPDIPSFLDYSQLVSYLSTRPKRNLPFVGAATYLCN
jgi:hypothetical protein